VPKNELCIGKKKEKDTLNHGGDHGAHRNLDPNSEQKEIGIQIDAYIEANMAKTGVEALAQLDAIEAELLKNGVRLNRLSHACTHLFADGAWIVFGARVPCHEAVSPSVIDSTYLNLLATGFATYYGVKHIITWADFEDNYANVAFARRGVKLPLRTFAAIPLRRRQGEDEQHLFAPRFSVMYDNDRIDKKHQDDNYVEWKLGLKKSDDEEDKEDKEDSPSAKRARTSAE
jgi:hypothetical protein